MEERNNQRRPRIRRVKKKFCAFCAENSTYIDYKDIGTLRKYIPEELPDAVQSIRESWLLQSREQESWHYYRISLNNV